MQKRSKAFYTCVWGYCVSVFKLLKKGTEALLKLKFLFNNEDLAEMIVKNWTYDEDSLEMFQFYRISSNAIYPFRYKGKIRLLRFAPVKEKSKQNLEAELEFISYLRTNGFPIGGCGEQERPVFNQGWDAVGSILCLGIQPRAREPDRQHRL